MFASSLVACGGSSSNGSENYAVPNQVLSSPLTIDNTGVVPAFTDSSTSVKVYLHNNTNQKIKNIHYTWDINLSKDNFGEEFLKINDPASNPSFSSVAANGALALPIRIPALKETSGKGAALLKVSYYYNGKQYFFSHVVDFQLVPKDAQGVNLSSGAVSSSFGNKLSGFTTLYVYGGGNPGSSYDVISVETDHVLGDIVQGDPTGSKVISRQVATLELNTAVVTKVATGQIKINSRDSKNHQFVSAKQVAVLANDLESPAPLVIPSLVPFIDSHTTKSGKLFFYNAGTGTATLANIGGSSGLTEVSADAACSEGFGPGQSCVVDFGISSSSSGSGHITANDQDENNHKIPITWYNSNISLPQLGLSTDADSIPLFLHGINPYTGSFTTTVTNLSKTPVTDLQIQAPQTAKGSGVASIESATICSGVSLNQSSPSCSYKVLVSDTTSPDNGVISLSATASAGEKSVEAKSAIAYQVYQSTAQLALKFVPNSMNIHGNKSESQTSTLIITNLGADDSANISELIETPEFSSISGNPEYSATTTCNHQPLRHGESCQETITLKPQNYTTGTPLQASLNYLIQADGVTDTRAEAPLQMTVQPYDSAIILSAVTQSGNSSGDGKESSSLVTFLAGNDSEKKVVLTYKNLSIRESMTISGISFASGLPVGWVPEYLDQDPTSCYSDGHSIGKTLASDETCTITLVNKLHLLGDSNTSTNLSFTFPTLTITSNGTNHHSFIPNNQLGYKENKYYAKNYQAVIIDTSSIVNAGTRSATLKVTHSAVGVTDGGYIGGTISEKTQITPQMYLSLPSTPDSHCSINKASGAIIEICSLTDDYTVSNNYKVNWADSETPIGVDLNSGGTLTLNYLDLLSGQTWAYHNNTTATTGSGVNGGGNYISITPLLNFKFGGYSQWLYKATDKTLYTFNYNKSNGSVFSNEGTISRATSDKFSGGINAIDSLADRVFVATGNATNRITSCRVSSSGVGAVDVASCQAKMPVSNKENANLIDLMLSKGKLYALDSKGGVTTCTLNADNSMGECHATATDAPVLPTGAGGRQGRLMLWDDSLIYTVTSESSTQHIACKQELNGELDNCNKLNIATSINNSTLVSTSVLIPGNDGHAYLYAMSRKNDRQNQAFGCTLTKSGSIISISNCSTNPLLVGQSDADGRPSIFWGGSSGGNKDAYHGDQYVIYYDSALQHLVGTVTTSVLNDDDTAMSSGHASIGQEFYLVLGANYTIQQLDYITSQYLYGSLSFWISVTGKYNNTLKTAITGDLLGKNNGKIILDTFSIH